MVWLCEGDTKVGVSSCVIGGRGTRTLAWHGHRRLGTVGLAAGVADLQARNGEPGGTVAGLEVGGGEPTGTVLKPKLFKGR
jgi:hypothetical protein